MRPSWLFNNNARNDGDFGPNVIVIDMFLIEHVSMFGEKKLQKRLVFLANLRNDLVKFRHAEDVANNSIQK